MNGSGEKCKKMADDLICGRAFNSKLKKNEEYTEIVVCLRDCTQHGCDRTDLRKDFTDHQCSFRGA